ncbi:MAG TPA: anthranilate synthase component I family protein [Humisphaera sp.]
MPWTRGHPPELVAPAARLVGRADGAALSYAGRDVRRWADPLEALAWLPRSWRDLLLPDDEPWVGYIGYDLGRLFETLPARAAEVIDAPLFAFGRATPGAPVSSGAPAVAPHQAGGLRSNFTRPAYLAAVERALEYIRAGDVFQVNLAQSFAAPAAEPPLAVYRRLQAATPGEYAAFLDFGDLAVVSNSPELFFRIEPLPGGRRRIVNRPIKGTRPRLPGMDRELELSEKDRAELTMIVDLQRNDLGRVCEVGSVRVTQPRAIEAHPTVYHGVATVEGILRPDVGFVDVLRALFPCGSITGCPKIRAMEIIDELEPTRRGPYCGAIGQVWADGTMEFNVAIRTMTFKDGVVHLPVGGGIVADSVPEAEYDETLVKARAMLAALGFS